MFHATCALQAVMSTTDWICHSFSSLCSFVWIYRLPKLALVTQDNSTSRTRPCNTRQWCGLRPSDKTGPRQKKIDIGLGLGLEDLMLCSETGSCYARRHNDLEGHSNFSGTVYCLFYSVFGTSLLWRSTVAFTYLKVKFVKCLCLLPLVLVLVLFLLFWSCLGLVTLVSVLVLRIWSCSPHWYVFETVPGF